MQFTNRRAGLVEDKMTVSCGQFVQKDTDDASVDSVSYRDYPMIRHLAAIVKARVLQFIAGTS
jgi:hypothetical protein